MAANEQFHSNTNANMNNYSTPRRRSNAALPPLPPPLSNYSSYRPESVSHIESPVSPCDSPYSSYEENQRNSRQDGRYYGAGAGSRDSESGPFSDSIPLRPQHSSYPPGNDKTQSQARDESGLEDQVQKPRKRRRREPEKKGFFKGKVPWVVYGFTLIQVSVFIAEIVKNSILTSSPIEIHPQVNPMLGPSIYVLINMGARYVPCMKSIEGIQNAQQTISWPCPWTTTDDLNSPQNKCQLSDLCGFSGVPNPVAGGSLSDNPQPNQWFRFIVPIFLHAGIVHIAFNLLLQLTIGREMEKIIGSVRFFLVYLSSGIFGFVMGGNFAPSGIASTGASGSLFGIIAIMLLDLLYTWKERRSPGKELAFILLDIVISFALGLLPGLDNFSHIGGFLMGLVLGVCILHSPNALRERARLEEAPYGSVSTKSSDENLEGLKGFSRQPIGFFKGRKRLWWIWWIFRAAALTGVLVCFIVLLNNFYKYRNTCSWCKYLSCLPVKNWCNVGNIQLQNTTSGPPSRLRRELLYALAPVELQDFF